jgi:uncharacterized protein YktB (UPF0637 family)
MTKTLEGVLVKAPYRRQTFSDDQLQEFLACADPQDGPHLLHGQLLLHTAPHTRQDVVSSVFLSEATDRHLSPQSLFNLHDAATNRQVNIRQPAIFLWFAMFMPDSTILIAAHKYTGAQEIMQRIRFAYELCPDHIRAGVTSYNKGSIDFENGQPHSISHNN